MRETDPGPIFGSVSLSIFLSTPYEIKKKMKKIWKEDRYLFSYWDEYSVQTLSSLYSGGIPKTLRGGNMGLTGKIVCFDFPSPGDFVYIPRVNNDLCLFSPEDAKHKKVEIAGVRVQQWITRKDLREDRGSTYLFGDNVAQYGFGGQAKEMRGEENAHGIPTKKFPSNQEEAFFRPEDEVWVLPLLDQAFSSLDMSREIVLPQAGLGSGMAQLRERAPMILRHINNWTYFLSTLK